MRFLVRLCVAALLGCSLLYSSFALAWKFGDGTTSATINGTKLTVYTYHPKYCSNPSLLFVFHGLSRTASSYRDYAEPLADRYCMIVMAPLFDLERFPSWSYQRGGIVHDNAIQPRTTIAQVARNHEFGHCKITHQTRAGAYYSSVTPLLYEPVNHRVDVLWSARVAWFMQEFLKQFFADCVYVGFFTLIDCAFRVS